MGDDSGSAGLLELARRCEEASGPDLRKIEIEIATKVLGWREDWHGMRGTYYEDAVGLWHDLPPFTSSLDAAMILVPENAAIQLRSLHDGIVGGHAWLWTMSSPVLSWHDIEGKALSTVDARMTLPLALCAAALKARAAMAPPLPPATGRETGEE